MIRPREIRKLKNENRKKAFVDFVKVFANLNYLLDLPVQFKDENVTTLRDFLNQHTTINPHTDTIFFTMATPFMWTLQKYTKIQAVNQNNVPPKPQRRFRR